MRKAVVIGFCGYEISAVVTGKLPTVTELCSRYRWLGPLVLIGIAIHFYEERVRALRNV